MNEETVTTKMGPFPYKQACPYCRTEKAEARVKELEEAFRAYGVHGAACQRRQHWAGDPAYCPCTCGFERVLRGEEKVDPLVAERERLARERGEER